MRRRCQSERTVVGTMPWVPLAQILGYLLLCAVLLGWPAAYAQTVRAGGTGSALGTIHLLGEAYKKSHPQFTLELVSSLGTGGGIKALDKGAIQIALLARPLSQEETARGLQAFEYARTPFVIATGKKGLSGLSLSEIADIYGGRKASWPDGTPIRLVLRPASDADTTFLGSFSPPVKHAVAQALARDGMIVAVTDQDSASEILRLPGALGTSTLALILSERRALYALPIDGVAPSVKSLANGTYPYARSLYLATKGTPPEAVAHFIDFIRSAEGRRILSENGHVPADTQSTPVAGAR